VIHLVFCPGFEFQSSSDTFCSVLFSHLNLSWMKTLEMFIFHRKLLKIADDWTRMGVGFYFQIFWNPNWFKILTRLTYNLILNSFLTHYLIKQKKYRVLITPLSMHASKSLKKRSSFTKKRQRQFHGVFVVVHSRCVKLKKYNSVCFKPSCEVVNSEWRFSWNDNRIIYIRGRPLRSTREWTEQIIFFFVHSTNN
jgi:hypothetical protein